MTINPGDCIRQPHWPHCWPVVASKDGKVWLGDEKGGTWQYGEALNWVREEKETDDERLDRMERRTIRRAPN